AAGNTGSAALGFTLDTIAPIVTAAINAPATGVLGTAEANSTVRFTLDGAAIAATATADANGAWSYAPTGLAAGAHTIVARQSDAAGNTGSAAVVLTVAALPPTV